jgi:hypothetical protein
MKVDVYFNLHKKVFSVRHKGKVIAHVCNAMLKDVTYVVQPAGRAKVLRERKKNVHAFARGELIRWLPVVNYQGNLAKYNPYKAATFVDKDDEPLYNSDIAYLALHSDTGKPFISTFNVT